VEPLEERFRAFGWDVCRIDGHDFKAILATLDDLKPAGRGRPQMIIAALFLRRFVDPRQDWLHVDLYAWNGKERPGRPVGAEPQAVRALFALIAERYAPGR